MINAKFVQCKQSADYKHNYISGKRLDRKIILIKKMQDKLRQMRAFVGYCIWGNDFYKIMGSQPILVVSL